jgi:DNA polymerase (family 10)
MVESVESKEPTHLDRESLVRVLREIAVLLRARGESEFRARAYEIGAARLAQVQGDVREMVRQGRLREIPGIGEGLAATITELVNTGRSHVHESLREGYPPGIGELLQIQGLGSKKALTLWKELGIGDVDALEQACLDRRVRGVRGFGEKTEQKILEGIAEYRRVPETPDRRRLGDVLPGAEALLGHLEATRSIRRGAVAGDARRACEEVDAPELVVSAESIDAVHSALASCPLVGRLIERDDRRRTVRLLDRDVLLDVRVASDEEYAAALVHSTGSPGHVARLREIAERRGLALSEHGLFRSGERIPAQEEQELYQQLGLSWIAPELREDAGEIEAASAQHLPADLLEPRDVLGVVHSHSVWSDGSATLAQMARAARALGFRYLTVTEHSQTAAYAGGLTVDKLKRLWEEIDALNEQFGDFRLLKGIETDILQDGRLDYADDVLEQFEVVIGSIHSRHNMDERQMTDRILRAFEDPHFHILGHATGRLLQRRPPYALKMDEILDAAAERGVAIEVNGNPNRLDLKSEYVRKAVERGVKLVVSTDSHSTREIENFRYAVLTARRGWAKRGDVLNTLDAGAFAAALKEMRR